MDLVTPKHGDLIYALKLYSRDKMRFWYFEVFYFTENKMFVCFSWYLQKFGVRKNATYVGVVLNTLRNEHEEHFIQFRTFVKISRFWLIVTIIDIKFVQPCFT